VEELLPEVKSLFLAHSHFSLVQELMENKSFSIITEREASVLRLGRKVYRVLFQINKKVNTASQTIKRNSNMRNSSVSIQIRVLICMIILLLEGGILQAQEKVQYTLTNNRVGDGGTVVPGIGVFTYSAGSTAYINVVPTADWAFDHWEGAASGSGWYTQVYMDGDKTVTAVFVEAKWQLTIEHAGNAVGNTFPQAGVYGCIDGQSIGISSGTSPGVYFGGWSVMLMVHLNLSR
jgi:hypothetical protein